MRFKLLLPLAAIGLTWFGIEGTMASVQNKEPKEMTISEYIKERPEEKWLHLKDCNLNLMEAIYESSAISDNAKEIYIPIRPGDSEENDPIAIYWGSKDPAVLATLNEMNAIEDEAAMITYLTANTDKVFVTKDITGMVRSGTNLDSDLVSNIKKLNPTTSANFTIVDEGKKPDMIKSILLLVGGLVLGIGSILVIFAKKS